LTRPNQYKIHPPARVYEQALKFSANDVLQHFTVKGKIRNQLTPLAILILKPFQTSHLQWLKTIVFLFPIEVGRLADPSVAADIRHRHTSVALLQNERLLCVRAKGQRS
jgi:hypothetical protein